MSVKNSSTKLLFLVTSAGLLQSCSGMAESPTHEQIIAEMNQRIASITVDQEEDGITPRFNQGKSVGCLNAEFTVHDNIDSSLKHGLFSAGGNYKAKLRFANASNTDDSKKDIRGLSIKVSNVKGKLLYGNQPDQDFVLNSYPALFAANPLDFLKFIRARQKGKMMHYFINPFDSHLYSLAIIFKARKKTKSPFDINYWSTTPSRLGLSDSTAVKYSVKPCSTYKTDKVVNPGKNQLTAAMSAHLQQTEACFEFGVQPRLNPDDMPIEDASKVWSEKDSPFQTVATISIKNQDFTSEENRNSCEKMVFNPWQSLEEHEPIGGMNQVRKEVYSYASKIRNRKNNE